jgi:hypothetical protein
MEDEPTTYETKRSVPRQPLDLANMGVETARLKERRRRVLLALVPGIDGKIGLLSCDDR